jgi:Na+-translocating ferredoxin:NAD+ oxidoreductase subunit A
MNFVDIVFASLLANNLFFFRFLGLGEFLSGDSEFSIGRRTALLGILLVAASLAYWLVDHSVLQPLHWEVLRTLLAFAVVGLVSVGYSAVRAHRGAWPQPREFLVHSFFVGGVLVLGTSSPDWTEVAAAAVASTLGYGVALVLLTAGFRRLAQERIPGFIQGLPLRLVTLGLVWLALQGLGFAFGKGS